MEVDESIAATVRRLTQEHIEIVPYDSRWPSQFAAEKDCLLRLLPRDLVGRIEHFGSTAVPGLAAKPVIDVLVEVSDLDATRSRIVPIMQDGGYEYLWRPTIGDNGPPFYGWFIKRDRTTGVRSHHIHMVEASFTSHWDRLLFRDYLIEHPEIAAEYHRLKLDLTSRYPQDRAAYTQGKTEFVSRITEQAKLHYQARPL